jgi:hypothetical protein
MTQIQTQGPLGEAMVQGQAFTSCRYDYTFVLTSGQWSDTTHEVANFPQLDIQVEDHELGIIRIAAVRAPEGLTIEGCVRLLEEGAEHDTANLRIIDRGKDLLAGEHASWIYYSGIDRCSNVELKTVQYAFLHDGFVYMAMGVALPDKWLQFRPVFEAAAKSLHFNPPRASQELQQALQRANKRNEAILGWVCCPAFLLGLLVWLGAWMQHGFIWGTLKGLLLMAVFMFAAYGIYRGISFFQKTSTIPRIRQLLDRDGVSETELRRLLTANYREIGDWFFEDFNENKT